MKHRIILLVLGMAIMFGGCQKDLTTDPNNTLYSSDLEQFVRVWEGFNSSYAMWPIDTTDWDRIYDKYYEVFSKSSMSDSIWEKTWEELTSSLIDHHLQVVLKRPTSDYLAALSPGSKEVQSRDYYHAKNSPEDCLEQLSTIGRLSDAEKTETFYYGIIDSNIAYLRISQFNITELQLTWDNQLMVFDKFKKAVSSSQIKAVIVDMRGNSGGYANDLGILMSCFVTEPYQIGYTQEKIGLGRMDLGPRIPFRVFPTSDSQKIDCPIIALVDVNSASMAEIAALSIKTLPNGYVVGERTYGATCALTQNPYADQFGSFGFPLDMSILGLLAMSGHYVYTPRELFTGVDGTCYEGYGIEPDKTCYFSKDDYNNGIDNQLECAIQFALEKAK